MEFVFFSGLFLYLGIYQSAGFANQDFLEDVFELAVDNHTRYLYVGGNNVVYKLDSDLRFLHNATLNEDCLSCENRVVVLEIDYTFQRLIVCGTANETLCWFLSLEDLDHKVLFVDNGFLGVGAEFQKPILRKILSESDRPHRSQWVVASSTSRDNTLLSLRDIYWNGSQFRMSFSEGPHSRIDKHFSYFDYQFVDEVCSKDKCFYLTLQQEEVNSSHRTNRLVSLCRESIFPYVESNFSTQSVDSGKPYNRALAITLGQIGIVNGNKIQRYIISVFGNATTGSEGGAAKLNKKKGFVISVESVEMLWNDKFKRPRKQCPMFFNLEPLLIGKPDWYQGHFDRCDNEIFQENYCNPYTANPVIQDKNGDPVNYYESVQAEDGVDIGNVTAMFTYTLPLKTSQGHWTLNDQMFIYITTSSGRIFRFHLTVTGLDESQLEVKPLLYPPEVRQRDRLPAGLRKGVGLTDQHFFLLSGTKVIRRSLDPCVVVTNCNDCKQLRGCSWCSESGRCQLQTNCISERCPPSVSELIPSSGPVKGNTVMTIKGANFGPGNTTSVTICDSKCTLSAANRQSELYCNVPISEEPKTCRVSLAVEENGFEVFPSVFSPINFTYTVPRVLSFTPPRILQSDWGYLDFWGSDLDTGANVTIVAQSDSHRTMWCTVSERTMGSVRCSIPAVSTASSHLACFQLSMTIDGYLVNTTTLFQPLCRYPNPIVHFIEATWTFQSGGTQVRVRGTNLDIAHVNLGLTFSNQQRSANGSCHTCPGITNATCLVCCMPAVGNTTSASNDNEIAEVQLYMRGRQSLEAVRYSYSSNRSNRLRVLPDPLFTFSGSRERPPACRTIDGPAKLTIQGSMLPDGVPYTVTIAGRRCGSGLLRSPAQDISCNLRPIWSDLTGTNNHSAHVDSGTPCSGQDDDDDDDDDGVLDDDNTARIVSVRVTIQSRTFRVGCAKLIEVGPDSSTMKFTLIIGSSVGGVLLVLVPCCCCYYRRKLRQRKKQFHTQHSIVSGSSLILSESGGSGETGDIPLERLLNPAGDMKKQKELQRSGLLIHRKHLTLGNVIGQGNFGCVFEGIYQRIPGDDDSWQKVAVKTLLDPVTHAIDLKSFIDEAMLMKNFNHDHVMGLLGLSEGDRGPLVVLPYMERGDLLSYVKDEETDVSVGDVLRFARDICRGMDYLASSKFVHRDLAARNCMLDYDLRVKVADFGLTRDVYEKGYYHSDNKKRLPIRWMALESIEKGTYTSRSDVWSLAVVIWEMYTRGITPYPGVEGWDILRYLTNGRRMDQPHFCPDAVYALMERCWREQPAERPNFRILEQDLTTLAESLHEPAVINALCVNTSITSPLCHRFKDDAAIIEKVRAAMLSASTFSEPGSSAGTVSLVCSGSSSGEAGVETRHFIPDGKEGDSSTVKEDSSTVFKNDRPKEMTAPEVKQPDILEGKDDGYFLLEADFSTTRPEAAAASSAMGSGKEQSQTRSQDREVMSRAGRAGIPSVSWRGQNDLQNMSGKDDGYFQLEREESSKL